MTLSYIVSNIWVEIKWRQLFCPTILYNINLQDENKTINNEYIYNNLLSGILGAGSKPILLIIWFVPF